jgi:hypothetical protein
MLEAVLLIEGKNVSEEKLRSLSLANAKQLIFGRFAGDGTVVHVATDNHVHLQKAILEFAGVSGVASVLTLAVRRRS